MALTPCTGRRAVPTPQHELTVPVATSPPCPASLDAAGTLPGGCFISPCTPRQQLCDSRGCAAGQGEQPELRPQPQDQHRRTRAAPFLMCSGHQHFWLDNPRSRSAAHVPAGCSGTGRATRLQVPNPKSHCTKSGCNKAGQLSAETQMSALEPSSNFARAYGNGH